MEKQSQAGLDLDHVVAAASLQHHSMEHQVLVLANIEEDLHSSLQSVVSKEEQHSRALFNVWDPISYCSTPPVHSGDAKPAENLQSPQAGSSDYSQ